MAVSSDEEKLVLDDAVQTLTQVFRRIDEGGACYAGVDDTAPGRVLKRTDREAVYVLRFSKHNTDAVMNALVQLADLLEHLHEAGKCYTYTEPTEEQTQLNDDEREAVRVLLEFVGESAAAHS